MQEYQDTTLNFEHSNFYKLEINSNNNMNPGDRNGSPDESFFNFLIDYLYKGDINLWKIR